MEATLQESNHKASAKDSLKEGQFSFTSILRLIESICRLLIPSPFGMAHDDHDSYFHHIPCQKSQAFKAVHGSWSLVLLINSVIDILPRHHLKPSSRPSLDLPLLLLTLIRLCINCIPAYRSRTTMSVPQNSEKNFLGMHVCNCISIVLYHQFHICFYIAIVLQHIMAFIYLYLYHVYSI